MMAGHARAVLTNNDITGNGFAGIGLKEAANPLLVSNRLCGNKGYGVLMHGASKAVVQDCLVCMHVCIRAETVLCTNENNICVCIYIYIYVYIKHACAWNFVSRVCG